MHRDGKMSVVQCWDDGLTTDRRLTELLRRYGAVATFNLCAGMHRKERSFGWMHGDTPVFRLGLEEMGDVYDGFTIANHSLTHPHLEQMSIEAARHEIEEGRHRLRQIFGQPVLGFAYPFGTYNEAVMGLVREAGHIYARTIQNVDLPFAPQDAMAFHPCCHFLAADFWSRYESAKKCGVFYFWGHSYEIVTEDMWSAFEKTVERISADPQSFWGNLPDLF